MSDQTQELRMLEAMLFAATEPLDEATLASHLPEGTDLAAALEALQADYAERGINVMRVAKRWAMRTAVDLAPLLRRDVEVGRRLSRAGVETLSIIAYHQPVTRAEIEEMRGVSTSRGTLDILLEAGWIKPRGRRQTPGRPVTWVTTDGFLDHFGLESLDDLPGVSDLRAAGLLDSGPSARSYGLELPLGGGGEDEDDTEDADPVEPLSDQSED
jgi:segregation and condensation protein B